MVMGIPSYFSYIIRNHPYIISKFKTCDIDNFYLDSNSIIYDVAHSLKLTSYVTIYDYETDLIQKVCQKILDYIQIVQPKCVFIAFDGVPPMAKMKQQKERRYKSWYVQSLVKGPPEWNTVQITPGTPFMNRLDKELVKFFKWYENSFVYFKLSTSRESGEGEHKLFDFIRKFPDNHLNQTTLIYGLDSDLIVLSLQHLKFGNILLLREAPAFMVQEEGLHVLNVDMLSKGICTVIGDKIEDYIFMTLLLGNDFMPHFPALNLRTNGFTILLATYNKCIGKDDYLFNKHIEWANVRKLIHALSIAEEETILKEYINRGRYKPDESTLDKKVNNLPMIQRGMEHAILQTRSGWQDRYYTNLMRSDPIEKICTNYIQMLEWNMLYYTSGCSNWTIYYEYMYPPLLVDLAKYIPDFTVNIYNQEKVTSIELLTYVLPKPYWYLLPVEVYETQCLKPHKDPMLIWAFCKYLWESHVTF